MKKIILFALLFLGLQGFAQKKFYVYNLSSKAVKINYISTITDAGGAFPNIISEGITPITIPAGQTFSMELTMRNYRFPYSSMASSPFIASWAYSATASSTPVSLTAATATSSYGLGYKFDHVGLVFSNGSAYKLGNVTYNGPGSTVCVEYVSNSFAGQQAQYSSNLISATSTEYIITITDL